MVADTGVGGKAGSIGQNRPSAAQFIHPTLTAVFVVLSQSCNDSVMASISSRGQALPEYLLIMATLIVAALAGVRVIRFTVQSVETSYAIFFMIPSP
jgi:hypothetical protein